MWYEIFKFEIQYRTKRPDTYIYFFILFLFSIIAVDFLFYGELDPLNRNSPYVIARTMGIVSALFMMISSMIMGVAVLRDFDHKMESLLFVNPIKKRDYLMGRFTGSFVVLTFIFLALPLGMVIGDLMASYNESTVLPMDVCSYVQPFLYLVLPTLFFGGAFFFVSGTLSRKLIIVYTQGFFFLMVYLVAMNLAVNSEDLFLTALIEPFTFQSIRIFTAYWTVAERSTQMIPMEGVLLYNRLLWLVSGTAVLLIGYHVFNFNVIRDKVSGKKRLKSDDEIRPNSAAQRIVLVDVQQKGILVSMKQLLNHVLFNFKIIVKGIPFWTIVLCGMGILVITPFNLGTSYGVDSYPTAYILVGELMEMTVVFFLAIIVFYSGELIWNERDMKINEIHDATPVSDSISLIGKFIGLILSYVVLIVAMIMTGIVFQISSGYYEFELDIYLVGFFGEIFPFLFFLTVLSFFFQVMLNHKFLAHLVVVLFAFSSTVLLHVLGMDHGLYTFGGSDLGLYSDMNGYGHFLESYIWYKLYWLAFAVILIVFTILWSVRGVEAQASKRWRLSKIKWTQGLKYTAIAALAIFLLSGAYIYYNTNILNSYSSASTQDALRAEYEKTLTKYKNIPQPKIVDVNLKLDLYPYERNYIAEGYYILKNDHAVPISEIHIQKLPSDHVTVDYFKVDEGLQYNSKYESFGYRIYELEQPLMPGDSIKAKFKQSYTTIGFSEGSDTHVVYNGTFFDNFHFPTLGYNDNIELDDDQARRSHGLEPKIRRAAIDDPVALQEGKSEGDGEEIKLEMVVSTSADQMAIVPGYLQKEWVQDDRRFFHYKMDKPMSNFYSIVSAKYEVLRDQWKPAYDSLGDPVNLEIYYSKGHEYNLQRMMKGMKKSLDYYTEHFGPYQYQQMRILETPIYKNRAQSFPNTVTFSEGMGFILDIDDESDPDMAFYVTAHEMAHQWWGHQINPANVQGKSMLSETLSQYAAFMVFKKEFSSSKVDQLLTWQRDSYLKGRSRERSQEMPLALVESGQDYVHYEKGLINMYALQRYISEDSVNAALKRFIEDWSSCGGRLKLQTNRYPTSADFLNYLSAVTPDSLQYLIEDLFETVTLHDTEVVEADYKRYSDQSYKVDLVVEAKKYRIDSLGHEMPAEINDWIDVGIYSNDADGNEVLMTMDKYMFTNQQTSFEVWTDRRPVRVAIDPLGLLIDRDNKNNWLVVSEQDQQ